jgi:hypothetical protein
MVSGEATERTPRIRFGRIMKPSKSASFFGVRNPTGPSRNTDQDYTLNLKWITSPSRTTYSLPSMASLAF